MAETSKAAASKAAAAVAETSDETKTITWHDLTFDLPAVLPEEIVMDWVELEAADEGRAPIILGHMLRSVLGPQQFSQARHRITKLRTDDPEPSYLMDLARAVFEPYGVSLGNSEASQDS